MLLYDLIALTQAKKIISRNKSRESTIPLYLRQQNTQLSKS